MRPLSAWSMLHLLLSALFVALIAAQVASARPGPEAAAAAGDTQTHTSVARLAPPDQQD